MKKDFRTVGSIFALAAEALRPPVRMTVADAAVKYRHIHNPGSYIGPWRNDIAPYLIEPMDCLTDLRYNGWVFCAPSQSGKTELFNNWLMYSVLIDQNDIMLVEVTQSRASDFSKRRIDRLHRHTKVVGSRLMDRTGSDTTFTKRYVGGMMLNVGWPSVNELSGRPIPRMFLTDYDRMPPDVDTEGSPFDLAQVRTTTFGRHGMTAAESSPSYPVTDPSWVPSSSHEAPPCGGILALYNRGDRRRWYWQCVSCHSAFEPSFSLLRWDDKLPDAYQMGDDAWMECPHCGAKYRHEDTDVPGKQKMNQSGRWLRDGETMRPDGTVIGDGMRSDIASFWLQGVAAAFKDWRTIVSKYVLAQQEYIRTGSEEALKATVNTDQSQPYVPQAHALDRQPDILQRRAVDLGLGEVPVGVRFLVAAVDVQKYRFVVQVMGVGVGSDLWVVDRFDLRHSLRPDDKAGRAGQFHRILPGTYREDWKVLAREVITKTYPLIDGSGRRMSIKATVCDAGGMDKATSNAYDFWRWLRDGPKPDDLDYEEWGDWEAGMQRRFLLYKGTSQKVSYRTKLTFPHSGRSARYAGARGEVPVLSVNVTPMKNHLDSILDRQDLGSGRVNFPDWLDANFYKELTVEVKDIKGIWQNPRNFRNESWDLFVMALAILVDRSIIGLEEIDWSDPPVWADEWDHNELVFSGERPAGKAVAAGSSLADLAKDLA